MRDRVETLIAVVLYTTAIVGAWALVALASGVFVGIARKAYNWVI